MLKVLKVIKVILDQVVVRELKVLEVQLVHRVLKVIKVILDQVVVRELRVQQVQEDLQELREQQDHQVIMI